jgi:tetrahydromethanopterin S-methyltransferase subunit G
MSEEKVVYLPSVSAHPEDFRGVEEAISEIENEADLIYNEEALARVNDRRKKSIFLQFLLRSIGITYGT